MAILLETGTICYDGDVSKNITETGLISSWTEHRLIDFHLFFTFPYKYTESEDHFWWYRAQKNILVNKMKMDLHLEIGQEKSVLYRSWFYAQESKSLRV